MVVTTYHGEKVEAAPGQWVVHEYYKGYLNKVYVCPTAEAAQRKKESLDRDESYMMNSPKHFSVRQIKE